LNFAKQPYVKQLNDNKR